MGTNQRKEKSIGFRSDFYLLKGYYKQHNDFLNNDQVANLKEELLISLKEVNTQKPAPLDQELFDKIYEAGTVTSETSLKSKIKEGIEKQFEQQSDQKFLNDMTDYLVKNTKFDLPVEFLKRWIQKFRGEIPNCRRGRRRI